MNGEEMAFESAMAKRPNYTGRKNTKVKTQAKYRINSATSRLNKAQS